ncbi:hypothetical protein H0H87_001749 [Tephrocybe sp. NHM501043]|nr:hypothetical protein H0H87_001749 [Tephrocybe sp. NHM501043]
MRPLVGGLPLAELNQLKLQFLLLNDFCLVISSAKMQCYAEQLVLFSSADPQTQQNHLHMHPLPPTHPHVLNPLPWPQPCPLSPAPSLAPSEMEGETEAGMETEMEMETEANTEADTETTNDELMIQPGWGSVVGSIASVSDTGSVYNGHEAEDAEEGQTCMLAELRHARTSSSSRGV